MSEVPKDAFANLLKLETDRAQSMIASLDFEAYYQLVKDDEYTVGLLGYAHVLLYSTYATTGEQLERSEVIAKYNEMRGRIVDELRKTARHIQDIQDQQHKPARGIQGQQRKTTADLVKAKFRDMHKPSAHGTVAEVAARYGVSKSVVRKMRAEGTLDQLVSERKE